MAIINQATFIIFRAFGLQSILFVSNLVYRIILKFVLI